MNFGVSVKCLYWGPHYAAVLTVGGIKLLWGCGAPDTLKSHCFESLLEEAATADAVLISHGTVAHAGALPFLFRRLWKGSVCSSSSSEAKWEKTDEKPPPVFCTHAAQKLASVSVFSAVHSAEDCVSAASVEGGVDAMDSKGEIAGPSLAYAASDVANAFSMCTPLRYHQTVRVTPRKTPVDKEGCVAAVYVHCLRSGLNIGGAVWIVEIGRYRIVLLPSHSLQPLWHVDASEMLFASVGASPLVGEVKSPVPCSPWIGSEESALVRCCDLLVASEPLKVGVSFVGCLKSEEEVQSCKTPASRELNNEIFALTTSSSASAGGFAFPQFLIAAVEAVLRGRTVCIPVDLDGFAISLAAHCEALWSTSEFLRSEECQLLFVAPQASRFLLTASPLLSTSTARAASGVALQKPTFFAAEASQRGAARQTGFSRVGFRYLQPVDNLSDAQIFQSRSLHFPNTFAKQRSGRLLLVAPASLDSGASRCLLTAIASDYNSLLLFPRPPQPNTTAALVVERHRESSFAMSTSATPTGLEKAKGRELLLTHLRRESLPLEDLYSLFKTRRLQRRQTRRLRQTRGEASLAGEEEGRFADLSEKPLSCGRAGEAGSAAYLSEAEDDASSANSSSRSDSSDVGASKKSHSKQRSGKADEEASEEEAAAQNSPSRQLPRVSILGSPAAFTKSTNAFALPSRNSAADILGETASQNEFKKHSLPLAACLRDSASLEEGSGRRGKGGGLVGDASLAAAWQAQASEMSRSPFFRKRRRSHSEALANGETREGAESGASSSEMSEENAEGRVCRSRRLGEGLAEDETAGAPLTRRKKRRRLQRLFALSEAGNATFLKSEKSVGVIGSSEPANDMASAAKPHWRQRLRLVKHVSVAFEKEAASTVNTTSAMRCDALQIELFRKWNGGSEPSIWRFGVSSLTLNLQVRVFESADGAATPHQLDALLRALDPKRIVKMHFQLTEAQQAASVADDEKGAFSSISSQLTQGKSLWRLTPRHAGSANGQNELEFFLPRAEATVELSERFLQQSLSAGVYIQPRRAMPVVEAEGGISASFSSSGARRRGSAIGVVRVRPLVNLVEKATNEMQVDGVSSNQGSSSKSRRRFAESAFGGFWQRPLAEPRVCLKTFQETSSAGVDDGADFVEGRRPISDFDSSRARRPLLFVGQLDAHDLAVQLSSVLRTLNLAPQQTLLPLVTRGGRGVSLDSRAELAKVSNAETGNAARQIYVLVASAVETDSAEKMRLSFVAQESASPENGGQSQWVLRGDLHPSVFLLRRLMQQQQNALQGV